MHEKDKLKILYLITKSNFGGAQRYVYDLAVAMSNAGHEVVVGFGGNGLLATKLTQAGIRTISIPGLERDVNPLADIRSFVRLLDIFGDEMPDVIHLNSSKMGGLGACAARLWNGWMHLEDLIIGHKKAARIIFTGHGWAFNEDRNDLSRFIIGLLHWVTIMLAHKTIAVSARTMEQVERLPFTKERLVVVHNGINDIALLSREDADRLIFGSSDSPFLADERIIVGSIAELHKNKGLTYAIEGIAQLKKQTPIPFTYVIIGEEGSERPLLEALIAKYKLEDTVLLAGRKPDAWLLLSAFDIFLLPSITEAFPYVILEAGNAGLPVIATAVGGIPEVIDDMESGILIHSKNPGEVTRALSFLFENPKRRKDFGTAIKKRITGRFNTEKMVEETLEVYHTTPVTPSPEPAKTEPVSE